jgi:hypothetical protein
VPVELNLTTAFGAVVMVGCALGVRSGFVGWASRRSSHTSATGKKYRAKLQAMMETVSI